MGVSSECSSAHDMNVVKKYPRTPHLPFSPGMICRWLELLFHTHGAGVQSDDIVIGEAELGSLHPLLSQETVLTEKLDGANCSIYRGTVGTNYSYCRNCAVPSLHRASTDALILSSQLHSGSMACYFCPFGPGKLRQ